MSGPRSFSSLWPLVALATLGALACDADLSVRDPLAPGPERPPSGDMANPGADMGQLPPPLCEPEPDPSTRQDQLPMGRLLRRASLVLRDAPPSLQEYEQLEAAGDAQAQRAFIDAFIDRALEDPAFYRVMVELGRAWFNLPLVPRTADAPEYGLLQQRVVIPCPEGSFHHGALRYYREDHQDSGSCDDATAPVRDLEPWWAPGQQVRLVGSAANTSPRGLIRRVGNLVEADCAEVAPGGTCGCDVAAARCYLDPLQYPGHGEYHGYNPEGHRRLMAEEPARFFAHLAWHDRPLTDLVLGDSMVGPTKTQAAYVVQGLRGGALELLQDDRWWNPARFDGALVDPEHHPEDPLAWREFKQHERNPFLLASRDYTYDPRVQTEPMLGIPSAGVLTSMGVLASYPRERLRASRLLETLACETFSPPSADQEFNVYREDPAAEGGCQHCHRRIDPAAIHFKRFAKAGSGLEGWGASYYMPGIGSRWHWPEAWLKGQWPYHSEPFSHWLRWYTIDTRMTPVTQAQLMANPEALFIDFLPPDQTLLGQTSDGTVGPLGFGKLLVASGALDRCLVRQLHKHVLGRDIDPAVEAGYLEALTTRFVAQGRQVRPMIKVMMGSSLFARGI